MKNVQEIFAKFCSNQYLIDNYEQFLSYETNDENEVISLELFDSDYHGDFPFINQLALFISHFKKLKALEIDIWGKIITTFQPLSDLQELETIYVASNTEISDLQFVMQMKNLKSIYLQNSNIQDISELANNKKLTYIGLPFSQIQDISSLRDLPELTSINFNNNQISKIDGLQYCPKLQQIYLNNNQIQSIDSLQSLYELTHLSVSNNQISALSALRYLNKIEFLELRNNQISDIDFLDNFKALRNLDVTNNRITQISSIKECHQLTFLRIAENQIENIDFLEANQSLLRLNISKNPIRSVEVLSTLKSVENLFASHINFQISDDFQFQSQLSKLVLSHCQLKKVDFLLNQKKLQQVNLSNNQIENIDGFERLKALQSLNLQNNTITEAIPYQFLKLAAIDLRGNKFGNQLFGNFSPYYKSSTVHYTDIFQEIAADEKAEIRDLRQLIADNLLAKGEKEAALAAYYFDAAEIYPNTKRNLLDVRIYLLKHLANQNSPFVFTLQERLNQTLRLHFASTDAERELKAYYADLIENIADRNIEKPSMHADFYAYFFYERTLAHEADFAPIVERLFKEEDILVRDILIQSQPKPRTKRYERKTSANDSNEFAGCIVWLALMILLGILMFAGLIPMEVLRAMVFVMAIVKLIFYLSEKR